MANFKAGDRVRVVAVDAHALSYAIGCEGVVIGPDLTGVYQYDVELGCEGFNPWGFNDRHLAPLTPPAEDAWAADAVRKVTKPQHVEPVREDFQTFTARVVREMRRKLAAP
jgi:hypothetical protein